MVDEPDADLFADVRLDAADLDPFPLSEGLPDQPVQATVVLPRSLWTVVIDHCVATGQDASGWVGDAILTRASQSGFMERNRVAPLRRARAHL